MNPIKKLVFYIDMNIGSPSILVSTLPTLFEIKINKSSSAGHLISL